MMNVRTLAELLRERAQAAPEALACTFLEDGGTESPLTYAELDRAARAVAIRLLGELATGERALLLYPPGLSFIAGFFGCLYAGVIAVPAYPPRGARSYKRLLGILRDSGAKVALTTDEGKAMAALTGEGAFGDLRWLSTTDAIDGANSARAVDLSASDIAFLQYTSGSTSDPKGVVLTHANLLHNLELIDRAFEFCPESCVVSWLPPYHDMGLIGTVLGPIYGGFPAVLMSPLSFVQRPLRWLKAITRYRGTTCGGPSFAYGMCVDKVSDAQRAELDLSSWSLAFCGAEPISSEVLQRFAEAFAPAGFRRQALYPCYGLAESTLLVTGGLKSDPPLLYAADAGSLERGDVAPGEGASARALVGCGRPWGDTRVAIVDPETGIPCPSDHVGEIWVKSGSVASGYWGREEETRAAFHVRLGDSREGPFLRTGDLGFLRDGELYITGRIKDLILIDGRNIYPQDLEWTAERAHPHIRPGGTAAFSIDMEGAERVFVIHEVEARSSHEIEELAAAMQRCIAAEHDVSVHGMVFIKPRSLPRTSSGKIARRVCRAEYLSGVLPVLGEWRAGDWRWAGAEGRTP